VLGVSWCSRSSPSSKCYADHTPSFLNSHSRATSLKRTDSKQLVSAALSPALPSTSFALFSCRQDSVYTSNSSALCYDHSFQELRCRNSMEQSPRVAYFVVAQLLKKIPAFYETRVFITVFTRARHWTIS
jgi:hypothetical protein